MGVVQYMPHATLAEFVAAASVSQAGATAESRSSMHLPWSKAGEHNPPCDAKRLAAAQPLQLAAAQPLNRAQSWCRPLEQPFTSPMAPLNPLQFRIVLVC